MVGNDVINGNSGTDVLYGGPNNDILFGDEANDLVIGHMVLIRWRAVPELTRSST